MRAVGRVHDGMGAVDQLELVVAPAGPLGALVLAVADLDRRPPERLRGVDASKTSWIISQSPSWRLFQSLKT